MPAPQLLDIKLRIVSTALKAATESMAPWILPKMICRHGTTPRPLLAIYQLCSKPHARATPRDMHEMC